MYLIQPTSSQLIVKSNMVIVEWIFAMVMTSFGIYFVWLAWLSPSEFGLSPSVAVTAFSLFLFLVSIKEVLKPIIVTTFYKSDGFFIQERKWLWKSETIQHPIQTIRDIHISRKGNFGENRSYFKISVELDSEERLPLSSGHYCSEESVNQNARAIRTFIELIPQ